jgi:hypothetical protein
MGQEFSGSHESWVILGQPLAVLQRSPDVYDTECNARLRSLQNLLHCAALYIDRVQVRIHLQRHDEIPIDERFRSVDVGSDRFVDHLSPVIWSDDDAPSSAE